MSQDTAKSETSNIKTHHLGLNIKFNLSFLAVKHKLRGQFFNQLSSGKEGKQTLTGMNSYHVGIVKSALDTYQFSNGMKELTQEKSSIRASIVKKYLASPQPARNMD